MTDELLQQKVCAVICQGSGLKAREIAKQLNLDRQTVNRVLFRSSLLQELCYQDKDHLWHGIIKQVQPHAGLWEFSGFYSTVSDFLSLTEEAWLDRLTEGCDRIGRSLNDRRGLFHSFRDCRKQMLRLFNDLGEMLGNRCANWEIVFEFRLKRGCHVRIYADVLVIAEDKVFTLEFKMKDVIEPAEISQAAKYVPYLEIVFGPAYEVIPALVLTTTRELFEFVPIAGEDALLPVCSGDMLFNVFDEYLGFLA